MKKLGWIHIIVLVLALLCISVIAANAQNCPPIPVCAPYGATPNGFGVQELNAGNDGCLSGEHNSTWLSVTILTGGTFTFTIDPNVNSNDFDYGVWGPNIGCPPVGLPLRCSYAIQGGNGNTGLNTTALDASEGVFGDQWTQQLTVLAGETYLILVDNFTTNSGFNISFGGTATLNCFPLPVEFVSADCNQTNSGIELNWSTASETNNWKFEVHRCIDGINYYPIDTVYSISNTTTQPSYYRSVDTYPGNGYNFYLIKQIDFNGQSQDLGPIVCSYESTTSTVVEYFNLLGQIVANPTSGVFIEKKTINGQSTFKKVYFE